MASPYQNNITTLAKKLKPFMQQTIHTTVITESGNADTVDGYHASDFLTPAYLVASTNGNLSNERVLAGMEGITATDDGPGGNMTLTVNEDYGFTWTAEHEFQDITHASDILPRLTDTYDLGSSTKLWRKGYLSELDAVVFAQQTQTLLGGWFTVGHDEGTLAADVASGDTTIDFGKAMTPGDFLVMRAALKVEYLSVGSLVTGTTYNVTRNLDGTGANDWPAGTPFSVRGALGDGWIELNAYDTPRLSIFVQGATYNAQTEMARLGDMYGAYGTGANHRYGIGIGDYSGGNYLSYNAESADAFVLKVGGGKIVADGDGLAAYVGTSLVSDRAYRFIAGSREMAKLGAWSDEGMDLDALDLHVGSATYAQHVHMSMGALTPSTKNALVTLDADRGGTRLRFGIVNYATEDYFSFSGAPVRFDENLVSVKGGATYSVYGWKHDVRLTSTSWDGDARSSSSAAAKIKIDLSAVFGVPAGVKAVDVYVAVRDSGSSANQFCGIILGPDDVATRGRPFWCSGLPNDYYSYGHAIIPCDDNGDIYYQTFASGASTLDVILEIYGYEI